MSELDRFGLKGLQARLDGVYGVDQAAIASGMDLNLLGLDLNRYIYIVLVHDLHITNDNSDQTRYVRIGQVHLLIQQADLSFQNSPCHQHIQSQMLLRSTRR